VATHRTRLIVKTAIYTLLAAGGIGAAGGYALYKSGWYNIGASAQHLQPVYSFLEQAMHNSVRHHAKTVVTPSLGDPGQLRRGAALYREHCAQCHGGPGFAPSAHGKSMQPVPGPLVDASARWKPHELYWITRHGIKMSGMPAWEVRLSEGDTWAVVAFLTRLPGLDARAYRDMTAVAAAPGPDDAQTPAAIGTVNTAASSSNATGGALLRGDAGRGKKILAQYACQSCHRVPGVTGSDVAVGRPLDGLARRAVMAGKLAPTQDNLVRWIRNPQAIDPQTAMPDMGVTERDALDISAYLLSK
jgi:mono/diheme cytochrome c family protein